MYPKNGFGFGGLGADIKPSNGNGTRGGLEQAHDHFDGGGFTRAVGSQKAEQLTGRHFQIDTPDRFQVLITFNCIFNL